MSNVTFQCRSGWIELAASVHISDKGILGRTVIGNLASGFHPMLPHMGRGAAL